jgi:hypothetical protein
MTEPDQEEELARDRRINFLCNTIEQFAKDNGSGREYLTALTVCVGRYLRAMPDPSMRESTVQQFLQAVRRFAHARIEQ